MTLTTIAIAIGGIAVLVVAVWFLAWWTTLWTNDDDWSDDRYRQATERLADAAGELLFESNKGPVTNDALSGLAIALRNYRLVAKETRNDTD